MRIYIAGRFEAQKRLRTARHELQNLGQEVVSSWLDEAPGMPPVKAERRDLEDLYKSHLIILDTFDEDDRGGREVEWGVALGLRCYGGFGDGGDFLPYLWLVGPKRNIFHELADRHFSTWQDCYDFIREGSSE